jgi:hypothetical protein
MIEHSKWSGILIAMESNTRSTVRDDYQTNARAITLEEYLISRDLNIMNEESELTTLQSDRGSSNIDLTILNNWLLQNFTDWEISEEDSCSDHNIIKFKIEYDNKHEMQHTHNGTRYIINKQNYNRFDKNLTELAAVKVELKNSEDLLSLDSDLASHIKETHDLQRAVEKLQEAITLARSKAFKTRETTKKGQGKNQFHGGPRN